MCGQILQAYTNKLIYGDTASSFSLGDGALDLDSSLLINSKSTSEGKDRRRRIEKGQQRHATLPPFKPSLPPLALLHRPLASECPRVNTKLLAILHHSTARVCLQSAALQSYQQDPVQILYWKRSQCELTPHFAFRIIRGKKTGKKNNIVYTLLRQMPWI